MRRRINFYIDEDLADGLEAIKERDGASASEQIRRAIRAWLEAKGIKATPKRARKGGRMKK